MCPVTTLARMSQHRLGAALRSRVAGEDAVERAKVIWGRSGERWFTPKDPVWRVHGDASMFIGGLGRASPAVPAPARHGGGGRALRLPRRPVGPPPAHFSTFLAVTTYGPSGGRPAGRSTTSAASTTAPRERLSDGNAVPRVPTRTCSPWVHVAETESFLAAYQRYAPTPLTPQESDTYVEQSALVAGRWGPSTCR